MVTRGIESGLLLGLDIGTQGVKGALVDGNGRVVAEQVLEHSCYYPRPGWAEQDMLQNWWKNPASVIRGLLGQEGVSPASVKAVFTSGLHPNFGPTDAAGNPLRNAILYSDNRAVCELEEINRERGLKLTSEELTPKIIWFLRNEPAIAQKMKMFFDSTQYLVYRLCGEYVTDTISVGGWGAIYHSPTASWKPDVCEKYGISIQSLPRVVPPLTIVGTVHRWAADETGLRVGTPVVAGTNDVTASTVSTGAVHTYEAAVYYGTAGLLPVMKVEMDYAMRHPYPYEEKGLKPQDGYLYDYPAYCLTTGDGVRWFRDEFGQAECLEARGNPEVSAYLLLDRLAERAPAGSEKLVFLPYLLGQRSPEFNPELSGGYYGIRRMHGRGHFFRAILEAWGFTIRYGLETYYPQGSPLKRLIATGGGARSQLWRQIVSDITGISQEYVANAEGSVADAYLAGMALGWFKDFQELQQQWVKFAERVEPDLPTHQLYSQEYYPEFVRYHKIR